ncbi:hypothetical protein [Nocardioides sp. 616]|uniref:hypothetical protein n=1 Tax=Nocardioides sp. 616 TaxID=2268090 RepID=UPI000CE46A0C|nr:hypothetical protein [Nocardioides sp. 616]
MYPALTYAVAAYLGLVAVVSLVGIGVGSLAPVARTAMRVGQLATVVVVVLDLVTLLQGHEVGSLVTHVGYAVAALGLPAVLLSRRAEDPAEDGAEDLAEDPAKEGAAPVEDVPQHADPHLAVLAVTAVALCVLVTRLQQTW